MDHGYGDIEIDPDRWVGPNSPSADARLIRAQAAVYQKDGIDPLILPRSAGSGPGYVFTGEPNRAASFRLRGWG